MFMPDVEDGDAVNCDHGEPKHRSPGPKGGMPSTQTGTALPGSF